ncbi:hypothetical protein ABZW32_10105 [Streptomyces sp. NPDC004667]|uniref:hypothetical protein n=1 Tax=Streptomyces sp. NPDC004667 TaxID=3154285 RepID=UPI0033A99847
MGTWTDAFLAPAEPGLLIPSEDFRRLLLDLGRERVVRMPWVLLAGRLCANASLNWGSVSGMATRDPEAGPGTVLRTEEPFSENVDDDPPPWGDSHEEARVLARGESMDGLMAALRTAPYGTEDISVAFAGVDFANPAVKDWFWWDDRLTTVVCYALAGPQERPLKAEFYGIPRGRTHRVRTCLVHTYKIVSGSGPVPAVASVAARHFGPDPVTGATRD